MVYPLSSFLYPPLTTHELHFHPSYSFSNRAPWGPETVILQNSPLKQGFPVQENSCFSARKPKRSTGKLIQSVLIEHAEETCLDKDQGIYT